MKILHFFSNMLFNFLLICMHSFLFRKYRGFKKKILIWVNQNVEKKNMKMIGRGKTMNRPRFKNKNKIIVIVFTCARLVKNIICYTHAQNTIINNLFWEYIGTIKTGCERQKTFQMIHSVRFHTRRHKYYNLLFACVYYSNIVNMTWLILFMYH